MTREQMLAKMELTDKDFQGYVARSKKFIESLNEAQLRFHFSSKQAPIPVEEAAKAFGPDVTVEQLMDLFVDAPLFEGPVLGVNICCGKKYRGPLSPGKETR